LKVNGDGGSGKDLIGIMKPATEVELLVRRPTFIRLAVAKKDAAQSLGIWFTSKPVGSSLLVTKITDGPFQDWNAENPDRALQCGDRILAVGSFRGPATELMSKMQEATEVQITVVRPASPEMKWWSW